MKLSNFLSVLIIIFLIAGASLWYTSRDNDRLDDIKASVDTDEVFEGVEYQQENEDTVPKDIDSDIRVFEFNNSFEHTKPGEYSEVIVNINGFQPGEFTIMYLRKAGTDEYIAAGGQELTADENGNISTRFRITERGDYEVYFAGNTSPVITVD